MQNIEVNNLKNIKKTEEKTEKIIYLQKQKHEKEKKK